MNHLRHTDKNFEARLDSAIAASSLFDPEIEQRTRALLDDVKNRGDEALLDLARKFEGAELTAETLSVTHAELLAASIQADDSLRDAFDEVHHNVNRFAKRGLRKNWSIINSHGAVVGEKYDPFTRVGIYVPGGTAPLLSTALMTITLAKAAGCPEIVVCTPCSKSGEIHPGLLFVIRAAGATEIYKAGGAQAIAAMAGGTSTIKRVQKIFGPGNAYVVAAKRLLFGQVSVDLLPGPSELLVLADDTANPAFIAADMLAQAEHGSGHERVWLVTTSPKLLKKVEQEIARQLKSLERSKFIEKALTANGYLIQVANLGSGVALANRIAPEHCEILTAAPAKLSEQITTAGAIFLGNYSPTVLGDYVAGPSHVLPTGGAGASFAGLTVDQFQRRTSIVDYGKGSLKKAVSVVKNMAGREGLTAHARSAEIRLKS